MTPFKLQRKNSCKKRFHSLLGDSSQTKNTKIGLSTIWKCSTEFIARCVLSEKVLEFRYSIFGSIWRLYYIWVISVDWIRFLRVIIFIAHWTVVVKVRIHIWSLSLAFIINLFLFFYLTLFSRTNYVEVRVHVWPFSNIYLLIFFFVFDIANIIKIWIYLSPRT